MQFSGNPFTFAPEKYKIKYYKIRIMAESVLNKEVITKEVVESYIFSTVRHDFGIYSERLLLRLVELAQREIKGLDFQVGTNIGKV